MLEKTIEKKVCDYAKSKGMLAYKFTSPARASVPDRLLITPSGVTFFIEFKTKGKKPTAGQSREIARLEAQNVKVFVVDEVEYGKHIIDTVLMGLRGVDNGEEHF